MPIPLMVPMLDLSVRRRFGGLLAVATMTAVGSSTGCTTPHSLEDDRRLAYTIDAEPDPPPEIAFAFGLGTSLPETALAGVEP